MFVFVCVIEGGLVCKGVRFGYCLLLCGGVVDKLVGGDIVFWGLLGEVVVCDVMMLCSDFVSFDVLIVLVVYV